MRRAAPHLRRVGLLLLAAAGPWCEAGAGARARSALEERTGGGFASWDLDVEGLRLTGLAANVRGHRLSAAAASVGLGSDGIDIVLEGVEATPITDEQPAPERSTSSDDGAVAEAPPTSDRFRIANRGIPIHVAVHGAIELAYGDAVATIVEPTISIDREGWPTLHASGHASSARVGEVAIETMTVRRQPGQWQASGTLTRDGGPPVAIEAEVSGSRTDALLTADGGRIAIGREHGATSLRAVAKDFPVGALAGSHLAPLRAWGIDADHATFGGTVDVTLGTEQRIHADGVAIGGVIVEDRRVSSRPIRFATIDLDGDASVSDGGLDVQLVVGHRDATVAIGGRVDREGVALVADLAPLACDALVASFPDGTVDDLAGLHLVGEIAATAALRLELAALDEARSNPTAIVDPENPAAFPGVLELDFPFLERCRTVTDPANVDLGGLRGPYRHRFSDDGGRLRERVFAAGAADFAPLGTVPLVASAFIGLEDMHFWYHDGFDREQIARAFWHNVVSGRVRRGASTISQQTARNLWLGIDRSIARKLQEAYLTSRLETEVSKTRILELYINLIELGPGVYGVDAASRFYFGVPATELDALQAVHLASLAPAPRTYAERFASGKVDDAWMTELRGHLRRMHRNRMISDAELRASLRADLRLLAR